MLNTPQGAVGDTDTMLNVSIRELRFPVDEQGYKTCHPSNPGDAT